MNTAPASLAPLRRGAIVMALYQQYPLRTTEATVARSVAPFLEGPSDLDKDLAYLLASDLVTRQQEPFPNGVILRTYGLTVKGVNLAEGTAADPGVVIHRGS